MANRTFMKGLASTGVETVEAALFPKATVAEMFGCRPDEITRDSRILWAEEFRRKPLGQDQVESLYAVRCFRQYCQDFRLQKQVAADQIRAFINLPEEKVWKLCALVGGTRENCLEMMRDELQARLTKRQEAKEDYADVNVEFAAV